MEVSLFGALNRAYRTKLTIISPSSNFASVLSPFWLVLQSDTPRCRTSGGARARNVWPRPRHDPRRTWSQHVQETCKANERGSEIHQRVGQKLLLGQSGASRGDWKRRRGECEVGFVILVQQISFSFVYLVYLSRVAVCVFHFKTLPTA